MASKQNHRKHTTLGVRGAAITRPINEPRITKTSIKNFIYNIKQSGSRNEVTFVPENAHQLILDDKAREEENLSRNEVLIGLLNTKLNPRLVSNPPPMPKRLLEDSFIKTYGSHFKKTTFKDAAGMPLDLFIAKFPESFQTYKKKGEIMVRSLMRKPTNKVSAVKREVSKDDDTTSSVGTDASFITANDCDSVQSTEEYMDTKLEYEEIQQECLGNSCNSDTLTCCSDKSKLSDEESIISFTVNLGKKESIKHHHEARDITQDNQLVEELSSHSDDSPSEWTLVKKKKERKAKTKTNHTQIAQKSPHNSSSVPNADNKKQKEIPTVSKNASKDDILLKDLMSKPASKTLKFVPEKEYIQSSLAFMVDIVSMWNTPSRSNSYIVYGSTDDKRKSTFEEGLRSNYTLEHFQSFFRNNTFTTIPDFAYFEGVFSGKLFGVFEIFNSAGHRTPCFVKTDLSSTVSIKRSQLWYRPHLDNIVCEPTDESYGQIYEWFLGNVTSSIDPLRVDSPNVASFAEESVHSCSPNTFYTTQELEKIFKLKSDHFVLVTGEVQNQVPYLGAISLIPWLAVYDFDLNSRRRGLLCANERLISKERSLQVMTWKDPASSIVEDGTKWCFIRGRNDDAGSLIDPADNLRLWFKTVQSSLDNHVEQLKKFVAGYTILNVVVIWPEEENITPFMNKLLMKLDENIDPGPKMIMFMPSKPKTDTGKAVFDLLCKEHMENLTVFQIDMATILSKIQILLKSKRPKEPRKFDLPYADDCQNTEITDENAAWLREDLDVLFLKCPYAKSSEDLQDLQNERDNFYRGGTLHWFVWYACDSGCLDVPRDMKDSIAKTIQEHIDENRGGLVYLFHEPGSGGTTLSQRILWDFHTVVPCAHLKTRTYTSTKTLKDRIEFLYDKTHKPVLLLIDGDDESKVKSLSRALNARCPTIIIYVKRHPYTLNDKVKFRKLLGNVSKTEARVLAMKFGEQCKGDTTKERGLRKLYNDVNENIPHCLYEFGLTTFLHEFKGLTSFVRGYVQIEEKVHVHPDMLDWQKILGFLSLAYFYGHTSLPLQFFAELLHKPPNYSVDLEDFPHPIGKFVVLDDTEGRRKNIRICHYLVAKEILECLLGDAKAGTQATCTNELSKMARSNLSSFCMELIDFASNKKVKSQISTGIIVHCLTRIFIFRDNKDMSQNAEGVHKKPRLSRIINDIQSRQPLFKERLCVLEKLTQKFPEDPNFLAHLGRFYAYCRPDDVKKAKECFEKALDLCKPHTDAIPFDEIDDRWKMTLMHIYHMYGIVLQRQIARYTGHAPYDKPELPTSDDVFKERLNTFLDTAKDACKFFESSRKFTPTGQENGYGYIGEMMVRLQVCGYVQQNFRLVDCSGIKGFLSSDAKCTSKGKKFIRKSVSIISNLFIECYRKVDNEDIDSSLKKAVLWYNILFQKEADSLEFLTDQDDSYSCRLKIAVYKLRNLKGEDSLSMLESINNKKDIVEIVNCYENILKNLTKTSHLSYRKRQQIELEYIEWLYAIRHSLYHKKYPIEDVLSHVEIWDEYVPSAMSKFYVFVLKSIKGIGNDKEEGNNEMLVEAKGMIDMLQKLGRSVLKPKHPREWIGTSSLGIKQLVPGNRYLGLSSDDRPQNQRDTLLQSVRVFKGTIGSPNRKKAAGKILLDLENNNVPVKVFFIPNTVNLASTHYAGKRVEFEMAFSLQHGYEAFNVKLLKQYGCSNCALSAEITSRATTAICPGCQSIIQKDALTVIS